MPDQPMPENLIFPDGVRFASEEEIPQPQREEGLERIASANVTTGYILATIPDQNFRYYSEINAHAPMIWDLFKDLCRGLLGPSANLMISDMDDELELIGQASTQAILRLLEPYEYQLGHDGYFHYALMDIREGIMSGVYVAPARHFVVWFNDAQTFRAILQEFGIPEAEKLEFLDQSPHMTVRLPDDKMLHTDHAEMFDHLREALWSLQDSDDKPGPKQAH